MYVRSANIGTTTLCHIKNSSELLSYSNNVSDTKKIPVYIVETLVPNMDITNMNVPAKKRK